MSRSETEAAATQVFGFLVGGIIFLASLAGIFAFTYGLGSDPAPAEQAAQDVDAENLADLLVGDAGTGWSDVDAIKRFGLALANGDGLDFTHLLLLNNQTQDALPNDLLEYEEAKEGLGLSASAGFRLHVTPLDLDAALQDFDFNHSKALYIGDFDTVSSVTLGVGQGTVSNANAALNASMAANTGLERHVLDDVGVDFDNEMHLTLGAPTVNVQITTVPSVTQPLLTHLGVSVWHGDVLYDDKQFLDAVLPGKLVLGGYDLLVLGSGIQHNTLTSSAVKSSIDTFVRSGGTLIVLGSPGANFNWMQPIMDLSASTVSGPVTAVDPSHQMLGTPWDLAWQSYPTGDVAWTIGDPSDFSNILMQGGQPVLAISHDGAIGSGHVLLSSIQPREVSAEMGPEEAAAFVLNLLVFQGVDIQDPTVQFGPDPPQDVPVSSAVRTGIVQTGLYDVPVRIEVLVWATP